MKIKQLVRELQNYSNDTQITFKLIEDKHDETQDKKITWVGAIDTSLLNSNESRVDIGLIINK